MLRGILVLFAGVLAVAFPAPGDVMIEEIEGLRVLEEQTDLDFAGYETWAPQLVDHLDAGDASAESMEGAYRIWGGDGIDGVIVNVTLWPTADDANRFVERATLDAAGLGLEPRDPPFDGVFAYDGTDAEGAFLTYYAWRHLDYGIAMVSVGDTLGGTLTTAAFAQRTALESATAATPSDQGSSSASSTSVSGDGFPIGTVLILVALIAVVLWLLLKVRRKMREAKERRSSGDAADDELSTDEIIERARARSRAEREVEEASERWELPDEY